MPEDVTPKRPASQYYWGDWWKDKGLQSCSQPARGLWHEMNTLMHEGEPYGHLTVNGRPMTIGQLANLCRIPPARCKAMVDELLGAGVPSIDAETGALFSRRMVRDERVRNARAAGGKEGAEHGHKGASHGEKGGRPAQGKEGFQTPLNGFEKPPPSSSSSSSSSGIPSEGKPSDGKPSDKPADPIKEEIWRAGKSVLVEAGVSKDQAGSFLGKLVGDYGQPIVLDAVRAAVAETPPDPRGYLKATCQRLAGERQPRGRNGSIDDWTASAI